MEFDRKVEGNFLSAEVDMTLGVCNEFLLSQFTMFVLGFQQKESDVNFESSIVFSWIHLGEYDRNQQTLVQQTFTACGRVN